MAAARRPVRTAVRAVGRVLGALRRAPRAGAVVRRTSSAPPAPDVSYRPHADDRPDPGEVVWAWVPYEEDDGRGKDRPVLVIGRRGDQLLGLMLSSRDHDRDAADEARHGRRWTDVGTGAWDPRGRPSEVRLDRLLVLDPATVRREGAALDRTRFDRVVGEARRVQGW
ncbi:type II toxin-antitoxin system PemK/MazF family toxin [Blastococcus sp. SYSU DS0619]